MKMSIQTTELTKALYRVQGIAERKSTMPILSHVLLEAASQGGLVVSATDMDVGLSGTYKADVAEPGAVAVHARQLYEVVKALPTPSIQIQQQDNNWIELKSGSSRFRLVGMAADQFPSMPSAAQTKTFSVPAKQLAEMIDRTIFCVSLDDNRHNLSGVFCEGSGNTLRMVATDGHRLSMVERTFSGKVDLDHGVIVPRKGFQELKRVLADTAEAIDTVEIGFSGSSGVLRAGAVVLATRLVEGQFPDYHQVIPKSGTRTAEIPRVPFAEALRRVSLLSQSRSYGVRISFKDHKLDMLAEDPEFGEAQEAMDIQYHGDPLTVGFNARYVLDVLQFMSDDVVRFELSDDLSPTVLKPAKDSDFLAVVMPMRI